MAKSKSKKDRKRAVTLPQGDIGPQTAAQMDGAVVLSLREDNGTEFRRKRRDHILEVMCRRGVIDLRQREAGLELHRRYCATQLSPNAAFTRDFVDSSPRPDDVAVAQAQRLSDFVDLSRWVPHYARPVVWHVCIHGRALRDGHSRDGRAADRDIASLKSALDVLAGILRI